MKDKKTLTLNMPAEEMEIVKALAKKCGMSMTATVRKAIRMLGLIEDRRSQGQRLSFRNPDGSSADVEFIGGGCAGD